MTNSIPSRAVNSSQSPTTLAATLQVQLAARTYEIVIGEGLLNDISNITQVTGDAQLVVVSNNIVYPLYGVAMEAALRKAGKRIFSIVLPDGEANKDWPTLDKIFDCLLENACGRKTVLIALGGGVIGDMVGFAAAIYQRGIPFIQVPTTLLAQVDSSVGGKTAINHRLGKNMVGAFYQPRRVIIDTATLESLPEREFRSGLAEVIKYGVALDADFFNWIEQNIDLLLRRESAALVYAIRRSCEIKALVVGDDEYETKGGRVLLNFGHTFGHAIESALGYGEWLHGEAVACGMVLATNFSFAMGRIDLKVAERIIAVVKRAGLPLRLPDITADVMILHMSRDKKNEDGDIHLILLNALGASSLDGKVQRDAIHNYLTKLPDDDS